jgi:hypothetical protein
MQQKYRSAVANTFVIEPCKTWFVGCTHACERRLTVTLYIIQYTQKYISLGLCSGSWSSLFCVLHLLYAVCWMCRWGVSVARGQKVMVAQTNSSTQMRRKSGRGLLPTSSFPTGITCLPRDLGEDACNVRVTLQMPMKQRAAAIDAFQHDPPTTVCLFYCSHILSPHFPGALLMRAILLSSLLHNSYSHSATPLLRS